MRRPASAFALALAVAPAAMAAEAGWYFNIDPAYAVQDRDDFRFGEIATDSNDPGFLIDEPSLDHDGDGWGLKFTACRRLQSGEGVDFSIGATSFSASDSFGHDALDYDPDDAPDGGFFNDTNPGLHVVFIDGPGDGSADSESNSDRLERGTVGLRLSMADVDLDYDSATWDFASHWTHQLLDEGGDRLELLVGGSLSLTAQDFDHRVEGVFKEGKPVQTSDLEEDLDETFFGPEIGVRGEHQLGDSGGAAFVWHVLGAAYWHDAELDAHQDLENERNAFEVEVDDDETGFDGRLSVGFGFRWAVGTDVWLGLAYGCDWWGGVAEIRNPEIEIAEIDGDDRWVADEAVRLTDDDLILHRLMFTIRWR
jgi:hypothetical protein